MLHAADGKAEGCTHTNNTQDGREEPGQRNTDHGTKRKAPCELDDVAMARRLQWQGDEMRRSSFGPHDDAALAQSMQQAEYVNSSQASQQRVV